MLKRLFFIFLISIATCGARAQVYDAVVIGAGIMGTTFSSMLNNFDPNLKILILESLDQCGLESSGTWMNAGTGHEAFCELNYTPELEDGSIDISKAIKINEKYQVTKQLWSYLVDKGELDPRFIHSVPHYSWVHGERNVRFLKARYELMKANPLFSDMEFTTDPEVLKQWFPLMMRGRDMSEPMAATRNVRGTDVDFGDLTRQMIDTLKTKENVEVRLSHEVKAFPKEENGIRTIKILNKSDGTTMTVQSRFTLIAAGGGTLHMLQKAGVKEAKGYAGFPVDGEFLIYEGPEDLAMEHLGKVYGQAELGAPPMSVPHFDRRVIDGKLRFIFGPFASSTTKFLRHGSVFDLPKSIRLSNLAVMLKAGYQSLDLVKYLVHQDLLSFRAKMKMLREFIPTARDADWRLSTAGTRVQVIHDLHDGKDVLQSGTEVVTSADGRTAGLLGASPGASNAVTAMLDIIAVGFAPRMSQWRSKIKEVAPSYRVNIRENQELLNSTREHSARSLRLVNPTCTELLK